MIEHGGRLRTAATEYNIPIKQWLDLSTGINPFAYNCPKLPAHLWHRLPEDDDDELIVAAQTYYKTSSILPVAGSQAAINNLPLLRKPCQVAVLEPTYGEHRHAWHKHGHSVSATNKENLLQVAQKSDVVIVANPNNPTGATISPETLLLAASTLAAKGGWLIVDEAFIEVSDIGSLASKAEQTDALIVLRSLGKFFGLAGARVGFVIARQNILIDLQEQLGPWTLSGPARYVAQCALHDNTWIDDIRPILKQASTRLYTLLSQYDLKPNGGTHLFQWVETSQASYIHNTLAKSAILTRLFLAPQSIRFGLPHTEQDWQRLEHALQRLVPARQEPKK